MRNTDGVSDVMVGEDVAGTDDHGINDGSLYRCIIGYLRAARDAKEKTVFSSDSKL
jgi:hypothetical protein